MFIILIIKAITKIGIKIDLIYLKITIKQKINKLTENKAKIIFKILNKNKDRYKRILNLTMGITNLIKIMMYLRTDIIKIP
jgi:hypothetical protein